MEKSLINLCCGIDVSKDTFNVHCNGFDGKYANNKRGFSKLLKTTSQASVYAMEATGNYHYRLAVFLRKNGRTVKVLNPASVCNWIKSLRSKSKTDTRDACFIAKYANTSEVRELPEWELFPPKLVEARAIITLLQGLTKLKNSARNINHAAALVLDKSSDVLSVMPSVSDVCKDYQLSLESKLCKLISDVYPKQFELLQTIPGIGSKTAAVMLASVKDLSLFGSSRQLVSYVGLAPRIYQSGTSVNAKCGIVKVGNLYLRSMLFMGSFSAINFNPLCKSLWERLLSNGRPKKVAIVAVMHRLVKIAYGVVKSGEPFRGGVKMH
jgi:transposase